MKAIPDFLQGLLILGIALAAIYGAFRLLQYIPLTNAVGRVLIDMLKPFALYLVIILVIMALPLILLHIYASDTWILKGWVISAILLISTFLKEIAHYEFAKSLGKYYRQRKEKNTPVVYHENQNDERRVN